MLTPTIRLSFSNICAPKIPESPSSSLREPHRVQSDYPVSSPAVIKYVLRLKAETVSLRRKAGKTTVHAAVQKSGGRPVKNTVHGEAAVETGKRPVQSSTAEVHRSRAEIHQSPAEEAVRRRKSVENFVRSPQHSTRRRINEARKHPEITTDKYSPQTGIRHPPTTDVEVSESQNPIRGSSTKAFRGGAVWTGRVRTAAPTLPSDKYLYGKITLKYSPNIPYRYPLEPSSINSPRNIPQTVHGTHEKPRS